MRVDVVDGRIRGYMTTDETADAWNTTPGNVRMLILRGRVPTLKIGNVHYIKEGTKRPEDRRGKWRKK